MATLNKKQKLFIVRSLAVFNTPQETVVLVKEEFNTDVTRQQVESYDPTKRAGKDLSADFRAEFEATRKEFLDKPENIPTANKSVRLKILNDLVYKNSRSHKVVSSLLEQIAKEMGGLYTNTSKTQLTGADGQPLNPEQVTHVVATPEQIRQALDELESKY
ncbi:MULTISPECIES: DUF2280 domain-containing protein [unclassified Acinetobacter]|uniref:DUF2280 domain-containing protein n=1 Tax=unclassified Acinetobacter TaxID=196816 RepID=UPI00244A2121|nr:MULTISPECIES: DUF2280 domain-containing protein [unclassified Acinetobacter]MDH0032022.1 DUF2280 domain-containing protein [Acinetobacter sp. GD04021]MDH0887678.1 DUF2280 domain-containing protein [Acinetobacter sp. GD03873]MDH1084026.1 DUF2280 domain-containing protein [Acinetobacter sp. GD03983]MDH2191047.1 DUF2280 domain-containing protein [Acinetobacter sp. GD03645]MDH2204538.1 DUF2280 domain-containing protein [Acinetobacter sp. GD03647]